MTIQNYECYDDLMSEIIEGIFSTESSTRYFEFVFLCRDSYNARKNYKY